MLDTLPKIGNDLPNTDEPERIAATLIVESRAPAGTVITTLKPVWAVDFYRNRSEGS